MGYSTDDVSDRARKAVASSAELKRSTLLQSFASFHMWAFAEKDGRMGHLPVSLCFCNLWALPASVLKTTRYGQCSASNCRGAIFQRSLQLVSPLCLSAAMHAQLLMGLA